MYILITIEPNKGGKHVISSPGLKQYTKDITKATLFKTIYEAMNSADYNEIPVYMDRRNS